MKTRQLKPLTLDGYILSEVSAPFFGGIIFFLFIFLMFQALRLAEFFIVHGVSLVLLGKLTALMAMSFLPTCLPIAFLIAVLVGFGRLSADSELVAMKANGFSLFRLTTPVLLLGMIVVAFSIGLNLEWVPWSQRNFKKTLIQVSNTKVVSSINAGTFTPGFFDLLFFADKVDTRTSQLTHVFIYDETDPKNPRVVVAKTGEIVPVKTGAELGTAAVLSLYNGSIHRNDEGEQTYQKINFAEDKEFLKVQEGADTSVMKPEFFSLHDLIGKIHETTTKTYAGREWRGELWRRVTIAITPILFAFLGIGFGTFRTRAVRAGAFLIAILTLTAYYSLQVAAQVSLQRLTFLPPWAIMEFPNIGMAIAAAYSFSKATW